MPDKMWLNEPIAQEREVSVRLSTLAGAGVGGMTNADALIKIGKPGANALTDAGCTLTEVTGFVDPGSYRMRVSAAAVGAVGEVEYEITDATGTNRWQPVHGYFSVAPIDIQYYGEAAGGGVNFVLLDPTAVAVDGFYASITSPAVAIIVAGTGAGQARIANGYIGVNQQLSVVPNWTVGQEPDGTSVIRVIPLTGTSTGGGGGGVATVDNSAIASAVLGFVIDPAGPANFRTMQHVLNVLAAWLAGQGQGMPFNVQQQQTYQSVGDATKTRLSTVISGGKRVTDAVDGT